MSTSQIQNLYFWLDTGVNFVRTYEEFSGDSLVFSLWSAAEKTNNQTKKNKILTLF